MQYTKSDIRKKMNEKRKQLTKEEVKESGHLIYNNLIDNNIINSECDLVLSFASYKNEPDTFVIYDRLKELFTGIDIAVPLVCSDNINMEFYLLDNLTNLVEGYKGIKEPDTNTCKMISIDNIISGYKNVAVLMPGLAFDEAGNRSGYGGGFYDRYLERLYNRKESDGVCSTRIITIGICHEFQILETGLIPHDKHDIRVNYIATPEQIVII